MSARASITKTNKAGDDLLKASRNASAYFERFDKSSLQDAASRRSTDWLLSEAAAMVVSSDHALPLIKGLQEPAEDDQA